MYLASLKDKKDKPLECIFISCYLDYDNTHSLPIACVLDTGVSSHICFDMQELVSSESLDAQDVKLQIGNGVTVAALAIGSKSMYLKEHVLILDHILYVSDAFKNIISISSLTSNDVNFIS